MIIALKNTLSDFRCFTETQVSDMLTFLTVSWLQPSRKSRTSFSLSLSLSLYCKLHNYFTFSKIVCTVRLLNSLLLSTPGILRLLQVFFRTLSKRQAQVWMSTQHTVLPALVRTKLTSCSCSDNFPNTIPWCNVSCSEITQKSPLTKQDTGRVGFFLGHPGQPGTTTALSKYVSLCGHRNTSAWSSEMTHHVPNKHQLQFSPCF